MNFDDLQYSFDDIKGLRCPSVRNLLLTQQKKLRHEKSVKVLYLKTSALYHQIKDIANHEDREMCVKYHCRMIGNSIYDLPSIWSGLQSQQSIDTGDVCVEHYYPRQWSGLQIYNTILSGELTHLKLVELVYKFTHIHKVTTKENSNLREFQTVDSFIDPEYTYTQADIQLVRVKEYYNNPVYKDLLKQLRKL